MFNDEIDNFLALQNLKFDSFEFNNCNELKTQNDMKIENKIFNEIISNHIIETLKKRDSEGILYDRSPKNKISSDRLQLKKILDNFLKLNTI